MLFYFVTSSILLLIGLYSCSLSVPVKKIVYETPPLKGEYIYRMQAENLFFPPPPKKNVIPPYPWKKKMAGNYPKITKEYFRCKGSSMNPMKTIQEKGAAQILSDCGGSERHSLPLKDKKEFVYPILIDLLNYIQCQTEKRVVVTSGHRCPEHNSYVDSSVANRYSKHQIGAEVSFYVQDFSEPAENLVVILQKYYQENPKYMNDNEYLEFKRWEKETDVSTPPWYNKEIFVKLYKENEGRNFDNRHAYPFIAIQVRYDVERHEKVNYSWDQAFYNFLRW